MSDFIAELYKPLETIDPIPVTKGGTPIGDDMNPHRLESLSKEELLELAAELQLEMIQRDKQATKREKELERELTTSLYKLMGVYKALDVQQPDTQLALSFINNLLGGLQKLWNGELDIIIQKKIMAKFLESHPRYNDECWSDVWGILFEHCPFDEFFAMFIKAVMGSIETLCGDE